MKILMIGNSYSEDTLMGYAYEIFSSLGDKNVVLGVMFIGGCSIDKHMENARNDSPAYIFHLNKNGKWVDIPDFKISESINFERWDYISFQQQSFQSSQPDSFGNLLNLINYVKDLNLYKETKYLWNLTWGYASFEKLLIDNFNSNHHLMFSKVLDTYLNKVRNIYKFDGALPIGQSIDICYNKFEDNLFRDSIHLSFDYGRYVASLTTVAQLLQLDARKITYKPDFISDEDDKIIKENVYKSFKIFQEL